MRWHEDLLKPSQPFFVLGSSDFKQKIYLQRGISHFYSFKINEPTDLFTVPDGCIDLLFEYSEHDMYAYACGTVLKAANQHWDGGREVFGVRFMPGFFPAGVNTVLKDLIEKRVLLVDLLDDSTIIKKMAEVKDFEKRVEVFLSEYELLETKRPKPQGKMELCMTVKDLIYESGGLIKISEIAEEAGYSERYINKVFIELMGFPPKTFCKIIQFQNTIEFINYGPDEIFTNRVQQLGYYDQPKFIKDFKSFAGMTPTKYRKLIKERNYKERIFDE